MPCVGDWMKLNCGDRVREHEGRHIGRVEAIFHGAFVKVRWENGWFSELPLTEVERLVPCLCGETFHGEWTADVHHQKHRCARVITEPRP